MFAIIRTGGKQYKVQKDDKLLVEKLDGDQGAKLDIAEVLYIGDGDKTAKMGAPFVEGAMVQAEIIRQTMAPKVTIFKKKRRQNYRRKKGHKQPLTLIQIKGIKTA